MPSQEPAARSLWKTVDEKPEAKAIPVDSGTDVDKPSTSKLPRESAEEVFGMPGEFRRKSAEKKQKKEAANAIMEAVEIKTDIPRVLPQDTVTIQKSLAKRLLRGIGGQFSDVTSSFLFGMHVIATTVYSLLTRLQWF